MYDTWAAAQHGALTRRGASFPATDAELVDDYTGITLATDPAGRVTGFAAWHRGRGYGDGSVLEVADLVALTPDAHRALARALGSFASVIPQTEIATSGEDVLCTFISARDWTTSGAESTCWPCSTCPERWPPGTTAGR